jgi:hypothetical protein
MGVSDLITKLKMELIPKQIAVVCLMNYFRLSKDSITNQLQFVQKIVALERLYWRLCMCYLWNYGKVHSLTPYRFRKRDFQHYILF